MLKNDIKVKDPLFWGIIWYEKYFDKKQKLKEGLKKFGFKKLNKAKKYHRWECKFWNNRLELMLCSNIAMFDCYNIDGEMMNYSLRFNLGTMFNYEEIKWFTNTMEKIHTSIKNKKQNTEIEINEYKFINCYENNAFEFEKKEKERVSNIVFWDDEDGGVIELSQGYKEDFKDELQIKINNTENVYFPILNQHLSIPIALMKEIKKEMESMQIER